MRTTDNSERGFQRLIVQELTSPELGYRETFSKDFNKEFCFNLSELYEFIQVTQPKAWELIQNKGERSFLLRLDSQIRAKGIIHILRKGVKHYDQTIYLFYPQPVSAYNTKDQQRWTANIFTVTQELMYADGHRNELDLVIFINGLPIVTMELKNAYTHQAVKDAIKQYQLSRDPKDKLLSFARCLVHFAADTDLVFMATALAGKKTFFLPFNKGLNDGEPFGPFGAGNPPVKDGDEGQKTSYLWRDILSKPTLGNIIANFAQVFKEEDDPCNKKLGIKSSSKPKLIFPRYHQYKVVMTLLKDAKEKGVGNRYLIQHSAGSGKSNSITWLAHQLVGLYDKSNKSHLFDSVIVVTDRTVLDRQIKENIKAFAQVKSTVEHISGKGGSKTGQLKIALANRKKIIICTVQTFPFLLNEMDDLQNSNFAIIIDEAHSSQSGDSAAKMNAALASKSMATLEKDEEGNYSTEDLVNHIVESRKMLTNASYFAFTATPKNKTLETFGTSGEPYLDENGETKIPFHPIHTYSMKQAIDEEFILDVLQNYTPYNSFYKLLKATENNPEFDTKEANKRLRSFVEKDPRAIAQKSKIMIEHFHKEVKHQIGGKAKAMVVTKSIESAMKYKDAFDKYLEEARSPYKAIVAFSGKHKHYKTGEELTESDMNNFPDGDNDIPCQFRRDEYKFLIVANKYQTGFDQPLLHTMYVDKQLSSVAAVQTLSRLNRAKKPEKTDTFVLDFFNKVEEIQFAFKDFYTTTILSEQTDINKLNDLEDRLSAHQVYSEEEVEQYFTLYYNAASRNETDPIINRAVAYFDRELIKDDKVAFKSDAKTFVRTYNYLAKIMEITNPYWEMLWLFLKYLTPKLTIEGEEDEENILEAIDMDSYRVSRQQTTSVVLEDDPAYISPVPISEGGGLGEKSFDTLENILNEFNKRHGVNDWSDKDKVNNIMFQQIPDQLKNEQNTMQTLMNSDRENAKDFMDKRVFETIQGFMFSQTELYKKMMQDDTFRKNYQDFIFDMLWSETKQNRPSK